MGDIGGVRGELDGHLLRVQPTRHEGGPDREPAAADVGGPRLGDAGADRPQLGDESQAVGRAVEPGGVRVGGGATHRHRGSP